MDSFELSSECELSCDKVWTHINAIQIKKIQVTIPKVASKEEMLVCKNTYRGSFLQLGGRCEGEDPLNCLYRKDALPDACNGVMGFFEIPRSSTTCPDYSGWFKCIKVRALSRTTTVPTQNVKIFALACANRRFVLIPRTRDLSLTDFILNECKENIKHQPNEI